jgi:hypothetical protein
MCRTYAAILGGTLEIDIRLLAEDSHDRSAAGR